jgi:hypothetical protein
MRFACVAESHLKTQWNWTFLLLGAGLVCEVYIEGRAQDRTGDRAVLLARSEISSDTQRDWCACVRPMS